MPEISTFSVRAESLEEAKVPKRFWRFGVGDFYGNPLNLKQVEDYNRNLKKMRKRNLSLFFYGKPHTGKTFLATYLLRLLLSQEYSGYYNTLSCIADAVYKERTLRFETDYMVIDDIGSPNAWERECFYRIFKARVNNELPTFLCSQLELKDIFKEYGEKAHDLICENTLEISCVVDPFTRDKKIQERKMC